MGKTQGVPPIVFEEPEEEEIQEEGVDFLLEGEEPAKKPEEKEPEEPPELKGKTKAQLAEELKSYQGQQSTNQALTSAIEKLGEKLATPQRTAAQTVQQIKKSLADDPEFAAQFNKEVFGDNPYAVVKRSTEAIAEDIVERKINQILGQVTQTTSNLQKQMLQNDPLFKRYENEVELEIQKMEAQTPGIRNHPQIYEHAFKLVKLNHVDDIAMEKAKSIQEENRKAEPSPPPFSERGGAPRGEKPKKQIVITRQEQRLCDMRGIRIEDYAAMKKEGARFNEQGDFVYE